MNSYKRIYSILMEQLDISKVKKPTGPSGPQLGGQKVHPGTMSPVRQRLNPHTGKLERVPLAKGKVPVPPPQNPNLSKKLKKK